VSDSAPKIGAGGGSGPKPRGTTIADLRGDIGLSQIVVKFGDKDVLEDVSMTVPAGARTAVIGPTAAGKTQLLFVNGGEVTCAGSVRDALDLLRTASWSPERGV
jgi:ABC-type hemin transport system ATPase subunit